MDREISPPPAKRHKTQATTPADPSAPTPDAPEALAPLDEGAIRIFSWNINGIEPFLQRPITTFLQAPKAKASATSVAKASIHPPSLRGFLQRHGWPAMLLLQEVKISAKDNRTQDAVRAAINARLPSEIDTETPGPQYEAHFVLPTDRYNARGPRNSGKVYGVCSILRTDLHSTYTITTRTVPWDLEGRISVIEMQSPTVKVAIFNIYAVNGTDNDWRDSNTGVVKGNRHLKKRSLHLSLATECRARAGEGWHIFLAGDMNVAPDVRDGFPKLRSHPAEHVRNRQDFRHWLMTGKGGKVPGFQGVDIWREMHGEERRYTYFPTGKKWGSSCDRIDYFIVAKATWEKGFVRACGILDCEEERGTSDHVPIWVDFIIREDEKGTDRKEEGTENVEGTATTT